MKKVNIKKILLNSLNTNLIDLKRHEDIKEALKPLENNPITTRAIKKLLPDWELEIKYSLVHLKKDGESHLIAWTSDMVYTSDKFDRADSCYFNGSKDRIKKINLYLNDTEKLKIMEVRYKKVQKLYNALQIAIKDVDIEEGSYNNPAHYEIFTAMGIETRVLSKVKHNEDK